MKKRDMQLKLNALEIRVQALESIDYIKRLDNLEQMVSLKKENKTKSSNDFSYEKHWRK